MDRPDPQRRARRIRHDGWTPKRQLDFLAVLARTRSVTAAASSVGVSRKSAYRLRARHDGALFAALWDRALEGHELINFAPRRRSETSVISRGNPPKVTKWKKCTSRGIHAQHVQLRDL
jgi:hypothetical protein